MEDTSIANSNVNLSLLIDDVLDSTIDGVLGSDIKGNGLHIRVMAVIHSLYASRGCVNLASCFAKLIGTISHMS